MKFISPLLFSFIFSTAFCMDTVPDTVIEMQPLIADTSMSRCPYQTTEIQTTVNSIPDWELARDYCINLFRSEEKIDYTKNLCGDIWQIIFNYTPNKIDQINLSSVSKGIHAFIHPFILLDILDVVNNSLQIQSENPPLTWRNFFTLSSYDISKRLNSVSKLTQKLQAISGMIKLSPKMQKRATEIINSSKDNVHNLLKRAEIQKWSPSLLIANLYIKPDRNNFDYLKDVYDYNVNIFKGFVVMRTYRDPIVVSLCVSTMAISAGLIYYYIANQYWGAYNQALSLQELPNSYGCYDYLLTTEYYKTCDWMQGKSCYSYLRMLFPGNMSNWLQDIYDLDHNLNQTFLNHFVDNLGNHSMDTFNCSLSNDHRALTCAKGSWQNDNWAYVDAKNVDINCYADKVSHYADRLFALGLTSGFVGFFYSSILFVCIMATSL